MANHTTGRYAAGAAAIALSAGIGILGPNHDPLKDLPNGRTTSTYRNHEIAVQRLSSGTCLHVKTADGSGPARADAWFGHGGLSYLSVTREGGMYYAFDVECRGGMISPEACAYSLREWDSAVMEPSGPPRGRMIDDVFRWGIGAVNVGIEGTLSHDSEPGPL